MLNRRTLLHTVLCSAASFCAPCVSARETLRLRIAVNGNFSPLSYVDAAGRFGGLLIEEMMLVGVSAGIKFEFHNLPWARAQAMVRAGEMDGFCTVETPVRQDYALFAPTPVYTDAIIVICRADDRTANEVSGLTDLDGLRIGEPFGNGWFETLLRGRQVTWVNDIQNLLSMIAAHRIDITLVGDAAGIGVLQQHPDRNRLQMHRLALAPEDGGFRIGLRKNLPDVVTTIAEIDRAIHAVSKDFEAIQARYLSRPRTR